MKTATQTNLFNPSVSYKDIRKTETQKEINNLIASGMERVSLEEYKEMLSKFGLKLCLNPNNYLHKYYNTANPQHYLCATTSPIDRTGKSAYNVKGEWYQQNVIPKSLLREQFNDFRDNYFTVLKSGHILSI